MAEQDAGREGGQERASRAKDLLDDPKFIANDDDEAAPDEESVGAKLASPRKDEADKPDAEPNTLWAYWFWKNRLLLSLALCRTRRKAKSIFLRCRLKLSTLLSPARACTAW